MRTTIYSYSFNINGELFNRLLFFVSGVRLAW